MMASPLPRSIAIGYGLGDRQLDDRPNALRIVRGTAPTPTHAEWLIETNLDDMRSELVPPLVEALLAAGADDVWTIPIQMKKGRPGTCVAVLVSDTYRAAVTATLFAHSTATGLRATAVVRTRLRRTVDRVQTPWGPVRVVRATDGTHETNCAPEFDDCLTLARAHGVPVRRVYETALALALQRRST